MAPKVGGRNADADALAAKIAAKKAAKEAGTYQEKNKSTAGKPKKTQAMVNPHTGKRDPEYTKKLQKKRNK